MAHDEELAERLRKALSAEPAITEKRMMGGLFFFQHGNMIGGCDLAKDGTRRFVFRVGKENEPKALARKGATPVIFDTGRRMGGMVFVDEAACPPKALKGFVELALDFVSTLPPKT